MRTRLSEIEQLRVEKAKLLEECKIYEGNIKHKLDYTKENFGHLLLNTIVASAKSGFSDLLGGSDNKSKGKNSNKKDTERSSSIAQMFTSIAPAAWQILQPILIGLAVKKVKSFFFKKKKK